MISDNPRHTGYSSHVPTHKLLFSLTIEPLVGGHGYSCLCIMSIDISTTCLSEHLKRQKAEFIITHNLIWANQKTELAVYPLQCPRAMFDVTSATSFVGALDVISSILSIHLFQGEHASQVSALRQAGHEALTVVVEEYRASLAAAMAQQLETCQRTLAQGIQHETEALRALLAQQVGL